MKLRPDLVLVKLPPQKDERTVQVVKGDDLDKVLLGRFFEESQRLVKARPVDQPIGTVVQVGAKTNDVWPGDVVLLDPEAGQDVDILDDADHPHPHLLVREIDIQAVLERTGTV